MVNRRCSLILLAAIAGACASGGSSEVPAVQQALGGRCEAFRLELDPAIAPGRRLHTPGPSAPRNGAPEGVACAQVTLDVEGNIIDPEIVYTTSREFANNFLKALSNWRYEPATLNGVPTEVRMNLTATYSVRQVWP